MQTFALQSRRDALAELCDDWLNALLPPEVAIFRPAAPLGVPLVFCSLLHYPQMGDRFAWETGTISQNEMYFAVPVERWRLVDGRERFVELGLVTPYIFVDDPTSAIAGRERFGFRKEVCRFQREWEDGGSAWGMGGNQLWSMSVWDPTPEGHALHPFARAVVDSSNPRLRGEYRRGFAERLATGSLTDLLWVARRIADQGLAIERGPRDGVLTPWLRSLLGSLRTGLEVSVFNFRQFVDPEYRDAARYQDLVRFRMRINDIRELAPLSGTHRLLLTRTAVRPIALELGLRVSERADGPHIDDDEFVDVLDALAPFVADADVDLVGIERLCWRHRTGDWKHDDGTPIDPPMTSLPRWSDVLGPSSGAAFMNEHQNRRVLDAKILLIRLDGDATAEYLTSQLPSEFPGRITPLTAGPYAALRVLATQSREVDPREAEELVWLDGSYLSLTIPVEVELGDQKLEALFLVGEFTDNGFLMQALRELLLGTTSMASFDLHEGSWFSSTQERVRELRLSAASMDRTASAARVEQHAVLDLWRVAPTDLPDEADPPGWDRIWNFARELRSIVSYGEIEGLAVPPTPVARRLQLTEIVESEACAPTLRVPAANYVVLFHISETFPFFDLLGMSELPPRSELGSSMRGSDAGRIRFAFARGVQETVLRISVRRMTVLWEDDGVPQLAPLQGAALRRAAQGSAK